MVRWQRTVAIPDIPSLAGVDILSMHVTSPMDTVMKPQHTHRTFGSFNLSTVVFAVHAFHFKFNV